MTETKNLEGVRVGDEVVHFRTGLKGKVCSTNTPGIYPLSVRWGADMVETYTLDGRQVISDIFPSIGFALPKVEYAPRPKRMVEKEIKVRPFKPDKNSNEIKLASSATVTPNDWPCWCGPIQTVKVEVEE